MIVSVSRRTDIPAFYSEWFYNRIREGFAYIQNPMNPKQVSKLILNPESVDCFVFWTKNANPMMSRLDEISDFNYYFQYSITGYKREIESGIQDKKEVIENFKNLSTSIGSMRVIWRYDPIFINETYTIDYHCRAFKRLCDELSGYTEKCVISFIDIYKKILRNSKIYNIKEMTIDEIKEISRRLSEIAKDHDISLETCSEIYDLSEFKISKGSCISASLVSELIGYQVITKKDKNQRQACGCIKSIDIGHYNTCLHECIYCYANYSISQVKSNTTIHDPDYPLLIGKIDQGIHIPERVNKSIKGERLDQKQMSLDDTE